MEINQIRRYRKALRRFQQLAGAQSRTCCSNVSIAQCLILIEIDEHDRLTMGGLASTLNLDQSTLSRTVDALVKRTLLKRESDPEDRRRVWISLTANGRRQCREIHEDNDAYSLGVFERIPASRRDKVIAHFEALVQAYSDYQEALNGR